MKKFSFFDFHITKHIFYPSFIPDKEKLTFLRIHSFLLKSAFYNKFAASRSLIPKTVHHNL